MSVIEKLVLLGVFILGRKLWILFKKYTPYEEADDLKK